MNTALKFRDIIMRITLKTLCVLSLLSTPTAWALDTNAILGGGVGGAVGAAVGSEVGGRDGAIIGSAIGAAAGTAIGTQGQSSQPAPRPVYTQPQPQPYYNDDRYSNYNPPPPRYSTPSYPAPRYVPAPKHDNGLHLGQYKQKGKKGKKHR